MMSKVAVLGGGSWGTTVATLASQNAPTTLWVRDPALAESVGRDHENPVYLPGIRLPEDLEATSEMHQAMAEADLVVMGVPSHGFRSVLEEAAAELTGGDILVQGAGRTDSGVHATGQVAHLDVPDKFDANRVMEALNALTGDHPVSIIEAREVDSEAHARFSATGRRYLYRLLPRRQPPALDLGRVWHHRGALDPGAMQAAAQPTLDPAAEDGAAVATILIAGEEGDAVANPTIRSDGSGQLSS